MAAADSRKRARAHRPSDAHASAAQAELADRAYRRLLASGTAVTLAQYLDAVVGRGTAPEQARDRLEHDRTRGRLVTVAHDGVTLVPTFQLTDDLEHRARVGELVRTLSDAGHGPWGIWDWAETSNSWLGARTPAAVIRAGDWERLAVAVAAAVDGPDA